MTITRNFKETVQVQALLDQNFLEKIVPESIECILSGDNRTGQALIRGYINAAIVLRKLSRLTHKNSKSLTRRKRRRTLRVASRQVTK
jgi:2-polyprenyl-3-methyl-5-hydroxy-6-metoxy-1,4-benzoquinol methylase